jgi:hypothetical protein
MIRRRMKQGCALPRAFYELFRLPFLRNLEAAYPQVRGELDRLTYSDFARAPDAAITADSPYPTGAGTSSGYTTLQGAPGGSTGARKSTAPTVPRQLEP